MPSKLLIEVEGRKYSDGTDETFYYSDSGSIFNDVYYQPLIAGGVLFSHSVDDEADGISVKLINDSKLDELRDYAFSGRTVRCYISRTEIVDDFYLIFTGTIESLIVGKVSVDIKAKSHYMAFDVISNPGVFTGVAGDLEGDISLEGVVKPRLFGKCFNIKPTYIDPQNLILGISWKLDETRDNITAISEVRDGGVPLGLAASYAGSINGNFATAAGLMAAMPQAGMYVTCLAESLIKLGSKPVYAITCDAEQHAKTYKDFIALAINETAVVSFFIDGIIPGYQIGHYITAKTSYMALNAYFKNGLDIYSWFDALGHLVLSTVDRAGVPLVTFVDDTKVPLKPSEIPMFRSAVLGRDKPPDNVDVEYQRNYTVQGDGQVAGSIDENKKVRYDKGVLLSSVSIPDPFGLYPIKYDVIVSTALYNKSDADILKVLWTKVRSEVIDRFSVTVPILYKTKDYILGIVSSAVKPLSLAGCITVDSTLVSVDSDKFSSDRTDKDCHYAFKNDSLSVGDLVAITSSRFKLKNTPFVIDKLVVNSREMSCTYSLSGTRTI